MEPHVSNSRIPWVKALRHLLTDTRGATVIEYALIASGVSIFILTAVTALGSRIIETFYASFTTMF